MKGKYKAIIFDFFGVIGSEVAETWFRNHFGEEGKRLKPQFLDGVDLGKISFPELMDNLSKLVKIPASDVEKEWMGMVSINKGTVELIKELKPSHKIGLCSNAAASFLRPFLEKENLEDLFDGIVISSDLGIIKSSPGIYNAILEKLSVVPQEALFIDDSEAHVKGAEKIGMKGMIFKTAEELRLELEGI